MAAPAPRTPTPAHFRRRRIVALSILGTLLAVVVGLVVGCGRPGVTAGAANEIGSLPAALAPRQTTASKAERDAAAVAATQARQPLVAVGSKRGRRIALTFDDGPSPYTARIMSVLAREHVPATFFWLGNAVHAYPDSDWSKLPKGDFVIADHTEGHLNLTRRTRQQQIADIDDARTQLRWQTGKQPQLFRPPYGLFDRTTLDLLQRRNMLMVLWSIDSEDYLKPGTPRIVNNVLAGAAPGRIVLMHDGGGDRTQTIAALPAIIRALRAKHYHLVSIPELLADPPPLRQPRYTMPGG